MMAKPIKTLELRYEMIQFVIIIPRYLLLQSKYLFQR